MYSEERLMHTPTSIYDGNSVDSLVGLQNSVFNQHLFTPNVEDVTGTDY